MMKPPPHTEVQFPHSRLATLDVGRIGGAKHSIAGLIEVDVTAARREIRAALRQGGNLSFIAWFTHAVALSAAEVPGAHALRRGRRGLILFEQVDIALPVERLVEGTRVPLVTVIRDAAAKSPAEIKVEIDAALGKPVQGEADYVLSDHARGAGLMKLFYRLPQSLRLLVMGLLMKNPFRRKAEMGTIIITSLPGSGRFPGWMVPKTIHNLALGVGSIVRKPRVIDGEIQPRDVLHLTVLFDHDVIDGVPASRFVDKLVGRLEAGYRGL